MKNIAIIPARGGSRRIPRKNIREFLNKPIIAYSVEVALRSGLFDEVMVSTDDEQIASVSRKYGANIPFFRSDKNSDDFATTADVLIEVIHEYERRDQYFDFCCCIYPTAPLIKVARIVEGLIIMREGKYDTVFPVSKFSYPIWRALEKHDNRLRMIWPENFYKRSQDLPPSYHDVGQWYWFKVSKFMSSQKLWQENTFGLEIGEDESQDIDNESDWKLAELKYRILNES